jgi:hypothetical protein
MSDRSLQQLNNTLLGDFRFFKNTHRDFSGNGNDLEFSESVKYDKSLGFNCYKNWDTYFTFPGDISGSFAIELFYIAKYDNVAPPLYVIETDSGTGELYFDSFISFTADFGTTATTSTVGSVSLYQNEVCTHLVYTREIAAGPTFSTQFLYVNGIQYEFSGTSGVGDLGTDCSLFSQLNSDMFYLKIYDDYLTEDECSLLYNNCQSTFSNMPFNSPFVISGGGA